MRSTDDLQDKEPFRGFGEKVTRTPAPPPAPAPKPQGPYGIVQDADGKFRTTKWP